MKRKILIVFGTRPEAIKMAPLANRFLMESKNFDTKVCITAQHREMLDQVLNFFELTPDFDLNLMKPNQNLYELTSNILCGLKTVLEEFKPDYVFVHGDTTTTLAASIASFYSGAKICHIEAGLRTFDKRSPFPEEMNRQLTSRLADFNYAPTEAAKLNLLKENIPEEKIIVTGNTVIDALLYSVSKTETSLDTSLEDLKKSVDFNNKIILVTAHRRENHGQGFINICKALRKIALANPKVHIIYPVHLNPNVQKPVLGLLSNIENIKLIAPIDYPSFVWLMNKCYLIITDSGGIQEEAPSLGKPVLVLRKTTERPEALGVGTVILVGTNTDRIILETNRLLNDNDLYNAMSDLNNPYGDGKSCEKIIRHILKLNDVKK